MHCKFERENFTYYVLLGDRDLHIYTYIMFFSEPIHIIFNIRQNLLQKQGGDDQDLRD